MDAPARAADGNLTSALWSTATAAPPAFADVSAAGGAGAGAAAVDDVSAGTSVAAGAWVLRGDYVVAVAAVQRGLCT